MKFFKTIIVITLLFTPQWAFSAFPKSDNDFLLLPDYCKARFKKTSNAEIELWKKRLGRDFLHIHHYCAGLFTLNIARRQTNQKDKKRTLQSAIREMDYVRKHASPRFILQPKISYDIGRIYEEMGENASAIQAYEYSIKLNPRLAPPYAAISDLHKKLGNKNEAIKTLKRGLKYNPDSKSLTKRLNKLTK